jgi:hypothetical protein
MVTCGSESMQSSTKAITHIVFTASDGSHAWTVINSAIVSKAFGDFGGIHQVNITTIRIDDINDRLPFNKLLYRVKRHESTIAVQAVISVTKW